MINLVLHPFNVFSCEFVIDWAQVNNMVLRIEYETHSRINRPERWVCLQIHLPDLEWNIDRSAGSEIFYFYSEV